MSVSRLSFFLSRLATSGGLSYLLTIKKRICWFAGMQMFSFAAILPATYQLLKRSMVEGKGNASQLATSKRLFYWAIINKYRNAESFSFMIIYYSETLDFNMIFELNKSNCREQGKGVICQSAFWKRVKFRFYSCWDDECISKYVTRSLFRSYFLLMVYLLERQNKNDRVEMY